MKHFYTFLTKFATKRNISIGLFLIVLFNVILLPKFPELISAIEIDIKSILDLKFSYSTDVAYTLFENLREQGRNAYKLSELFIDFPYAIIYGFTYAFIILILFKINNLERFNIVCLTPFLISWFDILENTGIIVMLSKYPTKLNTICSLTSTFTSLKWIFAVITFVIVLTSLIYLIILKSKLRIKN